MRLANLYDIDLSGLRLPNSVSNFRKLRPVSHKVVESGDQNNDPQPLLAGWILELKVLVQGHGDVEVRSRFLHQPACLETSSPSGTVLASSQGRLTEVADSRLRQGGCAFPHVVAG